MTFERLDLDALNGLGEAADEEAKVRVLTEAYVAWLERRISEDPYQYLWLHRRWKTRPSGSPPAEDVG